MAIRVRVVETSCGILNVRARMPFRFGVVTMRASPLFTLAVEIETASGERATGYAADFLAFRWFDKRSELSLADNCRDLIESVREASDLYLDAGKQGLAPAFSLWRSTYPDIERSALARGFNRLGASYGTSMLERGVIDALGRATGRPYATLVRHGLGVDLGSICDELRGHDVGEFLPKQPLQGVHVRHTVGLIDPLSAEDRLDAVDDGLPETLQDYLDRDRISYLKIKVAGQLDADIARLEAIAAVLARYDRPFHISLDGNEQYQRPDDFVETDGPYQGHASARRFLSADHVYRAAA